MKIFLRENLVIISSVFLLILGVLFPFKLVALGITLIFFVMALFKPKQALLILLIYIPTRPLLIVYQDSLKGIADAIIIGALIYVLIVSVSRGEWRSLFKFRLFEWAFFAFLIIGGVSALITGVSPMAIIFQFRAFLLMYLLYYIVVRLDVTLKDVKKFLWVTLIVAILLSVHGIIERLFVRELLIPQEWQEAELNDRNKRRVYGLINNPNDLGMYLMFAFATSIYLFELISNKIRWIVGFGLILISGVFFLTDSKGMLLIVAVLFAFYVLLKRNWKKSILILLLIVLGQLIVVQPVHYLVTQINVTENENDSSKSGSGRTSVEQIGGSLSEIITKDKGVENAIETSANSGRVMIIKNGLEVFYDHPIIGSGFGTFGDSATKSYGSPIYKEYNMQPGFYSDGQYIQVIAQTGILGVIAYAIFLLSMLHLIWKKRKENIFMVAGLLFLLVSYASGFVYNIWEMDIYTLYFFIILGFLTKSRDFNLYYHIKND